MFPSKPCSIGWIAIFLIYSVLPHLVLSQKSFPALDHIQPSADASTQSDAVLRMIYRVLPQYASNVTVKVDSSVGPKFKDTFIIASKGDGKLSITGSSGVAAAWGFYYYLSQYCNASISWAGDQLNIPVPFPKLPGASIKVTSNDRFRYYQNVCTVSYSFVWWDWARWEREIDWMAMNAINLPLSFNGQEEIWRRVYTKMGFTEEELGKHFGGPAFLAWARMGNMHGWGGPLTSSWHQQQVLLQHKILTRMREFGMIPVLPGFAGHVPETFTRVFPNASVSKLGNWGNFNESYCCTTLLDVKDPMFSKIGKAFITEYKAEFGTDHVYNADTFNEMTPKSSDPSYLTAAGKAVYEGMTAGDPDAVWLMQGWLFENSGFWKPPQAKALLTAVPQGKMIILDLYSEVSPQYTRLESYYGQPFIWCMLHNFGGTVGMYGALESVNEGPFKGRQFANSTMIGTGLTPEGINQNNVMYEFMMENTWRTEPRNISAWFENYAVRRYGKDVPEVRQAWQHLMRSVYNCTLAGYKDHGRQDIVVVRPKLRHPVQPIKSVYNCTTGYEDFESGELVIARPRLENPIQTPKSVYGAQGGESVQSTMVTTRPTMSITVPVWYEPEDVFTAWDLMLNASQDEELMQHPLFRYDLADISRQGMQLSAIQFYNDMLMYYKKKEVNPVRICNTALMFLFNCMEKVLGADSHFLLGAWISDARSWATNEAEARWLEYNARNQVTLWGPTGQIRDYANKQWSGLMTGYYYPRWKLFNDMLVDSLEKNQTFSDSDFDERAFKEIEQPFTLDTTPLPSKPIGDLLAAVKDAHIRFRPRSAEQKRFFSSLQTEHEIENRDSNSMHFSYMEAARVNVRRDNTAKFEKELNSPHYQRERKSSNDFIRL